MQVIATKRVMVDGNWRFPDEGSFDAHEGRALEDYLAAGVLKLAPKIRPRLNNVRSTKVVSAAETETVTTPRRGRYNRRDMVATKK